MGDPAPLDPAPQDPATQDPAPQDESDQGPNLTGSDDEPSYPTLTGTDAEPSYPTLTGSDVESDVGNKIRRLAHLDEYQHSSPVPLALFLMIFFIVGMVVLRFTRSPAEPKKRSRKAKTMKTEERNSRSL